MTTNAEETGDVSGYGDGTQGRHELRDEARTEGIPAYGGHRAGMLIDPEGVTVFDTQGIDRFSLRMPVCSACGVGGNCGCPVAEKMRQAMLRWERMHCSDCGIRVWEGAIYCRECRPYGFWHWLEYFSPIAWRRIRADRAAGQVAAYGDRPERTGGGVSDGSTE